VTAEERVFDRLRKGLLRSEEIRVISLHPPSGKSYDTDLIRFPVIQDGVRTRKRAHVDAVFVWEWALFLVELKGKSSESADDTAKLRDLRDHIGLEELLRVIRRRQFGDPQGSLGKIDTLVLGLGVGQHDITTESDFLVLELGGKTTGYAGKSVSPRGKEFLRSFCDEVTF